MYEVKEYSKERVILVTVALREDKQKGWGPEESHAEIKELALSSGVNIVDEVLAKIDTPTPNYLVGKGKANEIYEIVHSHGKDIKAVLFSEDLSSTQQRNLEKTLGVKIIDRTQLILDIFSQRANTNEGKLQVELAQLEYRLPRLSGLGIKLSRLGGGIGTRGPGEKMLETDLRGLRRKIKFIKSDLESLSKRRRKMRQNRMEHSVATVAVIGYTNAGKSTFLNSITASDVVADNRLFSTLDLTSRRYTLPNNQRVLFVDTVGFIHKLPHNLIEAFKATLEEVKEADLLLHILDISNPKASEQFDAVYEVLKELESESKPIITALNKADLVENEHIIERFCRSITDSMPISALKGTGFKGLISLIGENLDSQVEQIELLIPHSRMSLLSKIYEEGRVIEREDTPQGIRIKATIPHYLKLKL
ncbi:MAG: GTPase HflX [Candidatus Omnitrophica bacterium]|nr:GTPase HflX [Candidatus Omnitrophota bacterium]